MNTDTWLAISAGATLLLALATVGIIWQNHRLQKRQRKETLLDEIIIWATESISCEYFVDIASIMKFSDHKERATVASVEIDKTCAMFRRLRSRSYYMVRVVAIFKREELQKASEQLINDLEKHIQLLEKITHLIMKSESVGDLGTIDDDVKEIDTHKLLLNKCAERVIEEATKIKITNIC